MNELASIPADRLRAGGATSEANAADKEERAFEKNLSQTLIKGLNLPKRRGG